MYLFQEQALLVTTLASVAASVVALHCIRRQKSTTKNKMAVEETLRLTEEDANFYKYNVAYICTITWMQGDYESAKVHLQKRLELMVKKNPWLLGRIESITKQEGSCHLAYSPKPEESNTNHESMKMQVVGEETLNVVSPSSSPLSRQMPLSKLNCILRESGLLVPNGPREPVFKVSIVPCYENPKERFALLVQLSHAVGDGATYYKLFNMLCSMEEDEDSVLAMIPERITDSKKQIADILGKEESNYYSSFGNIIRILRGKLASYIRGKPSQIHYGWVDASKMRDMKEKAAKEAGIPFVSTNDVITSWYMNEVACPAGIMAINMRGRLSGYTDLHAGNYESGLFYNKEDFATPALIRRSLTKYRRIVTGDKGMPPWYKVATTNIALVTSWATFANVIRIEGCKEDVHLPLFADKYWPTTAPLLVIFRASAEKIGLAYLSSSYEGRGAKLFDDALFVKTDEN